MNVGVIGGEAERAQSEGNDIYRRLSPFFKQQGLTPGLFVAINIETDQFVLAETRQELMSKCEQTFGGAIGWVRRYEDDA